MREEAPLRCGVHQPVPAPQPFCADRIFASGPGRGGQLAGERVHGDDTTVPVLAKQKTVIGRVWAYVRDDRPFAGPDPPAALFFYSRNRNGEHPNRHLAGYAGILQADAYAGFGDLYDAKRKPGPITEAACWSHSRRKFSHDRCQGTKVQPPIGSGCR
jgi:hypothetical protein